MIIDKKEAVLMSFDELKKSIQPGLTFEKPNVQSSIIKINDTSFYYSIGQQGHSKKVTYDVFEQCYNRLYMAEELNRAWFKATFPSIAKASPCNFTTIGGLLQHFGLAYYRKSAYIKKEV